MFLFHRKEKAELKAEQEHLERKQAELKRLIKDVERTLKENREEKERLQKERREFEQTQLVYADHPLAKKHHAHMQETLKVLQALQMSRKRRVPYRFNAEGECTLYDYVMERYREEFPYGNSYEFRNRRPEFDKYASFLSSSLNGGDYHLRDYYGSYWASYDLVNIRDTVGKIENYIRDRVEEILELREGENARYIATWLVQQMNPWGLLFHCFGSEALYEYRVRGEWYGIDAILVSPWLYTRDNVNEEKMRFHEQHGEGAIFHGCPICREKHGGRVYVAQAKQMMGASPMEVHDAVDEAMQEHDNYEPELAKLIANYV